MKLTEDRFSTPSDYIPLIRDDQDLWRNGEAALLIRRGTLAGQAAEEFPQRSAAKTGSHRQSNMPVYS